MEDERMIATDGEVLEVRDGELYPAGRRVGRGHLGC